MYTVNHSQKEVVKNKLAQKQRMTLCEWITHFAQGTPARLTGPCCCHCKEFKNV